MSGETSPPSGATGRTSHPLARDDSSGTRRRPVTGKVGRGEPASRCHEPPPPLVLQGIEEFNRGLFFEQHETLEAAWIAESDPVRYLYQGILQIGVGCYHLSRGNAYGARRLWARGIAHLETFPDRCHGVDVRALSAAAACCLAELERVHGDTLAFDRALLPRIDLEQ